MLVWYALFASCGVSVFSGSSHSWFDVPRQPFHVVVLFLMTCTDRLSKITLQLLSTSAEIPIMDSVARPGIMCDLRVLVFSLVETCRVQLCVLGSLWPPVLPTIIGLLVWRKFVCGVDSFRNIPVAPVSAVDVSAFSTIC